MGVPKLAAWLRKKYPSMVVSHYPANAHGLYIDLNGLIHPCCHNDADPSVARLAEEEKLKRICREVEVLVATVRPQKLLYIATDGVAPQAKMNQQRARRYMSQNTTVTTNNRSRSSSSSSSRGGTVAPAAAGRSGEALDIQGSLLGCTPHELAQAEEDLKGVRQALMQDTLYGRALCIDNPIKEEIEAKSSHKASGNESADGNAIDIMSINADDIFIPLDDDIVSSTSDHVEFDSNCISPGTAFMSNVSSALLAMVEDRIASGNLLWASLRVVISSDNTPGEGEHKIIDFLRTQSSYSGFNGKGCHVIVGLDADLIFLTLALHVSNIFILRDAQRNPYSMGKKKEVKNQKEAKRKHKKVSTDDDDDDNIEGKKEDDSNELGIFVPSSQNESTGENKDIIVKSSASSDTEIVANTSYEYFDIDVVGAHLISELHGLCQLKGFAPANEDAFPMDSLAASNDYYFFRRAGLADLEMQQTTSSEEQKANEKTSWDKFSPCACIANSKVIDDFIVLAMLLGNDFLPRLPSAFSGESALDNLLELYVTDVLPYGFLTQGNHEINLSQLQRLFESCAKIETVKFRRFALKNNMMTVQEAAEPLYSPLDEVWRTLYLTSTGLLNHVDEACAKYVEGLRFTWRYYSGNATLCSWSWYYPFYHGPFALDVASFLKRSNLPKLPPPPLGTTPLDMYAQLLCILSPTSYALLPTVLGDLMLHPPEDLMDTFPTKWRVDYTGAYDKKHLAAVMIPFANASRLHELTRAAEAQLSEEEKRRGESRSYHLILSSHTAEFELQGDVKEIDSSEAIRLNLQRKGVMYMQLWDSPPLRRRPKTYSCTAAIPWITCDPEGRTHRRERQRKTRHGKRDTGASKREDGSTDSIRDMIDKNGSITKINKGPSFGAYLVGVAIASLLTAVILIPWRTLFLCQVVAVHLGSIILSLLLGIAAGAPVMGSNLRRNNIPMTYVDWLCAECLSLNFSKREKCFVCRAPFDEHRCLAVYSGTHSATLPLYDPDHTSYIETVCLQVPKRKGSSEEKKYID